MGQTATRVRQRATGGKQASRSAPARPARRPRRKRAARKKAAPRIVIRRPMHGGNVTPAELEDAWTRFVADGDPLSREVLVLAYTPLVTHAAGRIGMGLPAHVEEADLISYGMLGLVAAISRFEPERKIKFETYAVPRIRGAIIDQLRALDWVPRSVRGRARDIDRAALTLQNRIQRPPTEQEIADQLEIPLEELEIWMTQVSHTTVAALDEPRAVSGDDQVTLLDMLHDPAALDPADAVEACDVKAVLTQAVACLPEREKLVIALYYYEHLTLREIGDVLEVTESRVSQLHTQALIRMRDQVQDSAVALEL